MKKSVLITAVSGTGKSTVCKALHAMGHDAVDVESVDGLYELVKLFLAI
jgi:adenylate kinase